MKKYSPVKEKSERIRSVTAQKARITERHRTRFKIREKIGENLKSLMARSQMTPTEVAKELTIERSAYSHYIHGRNAPSIDVLPQLCEVLKCSLDDIYEGVIPLKGSTE